MAKATGKRIIQLDLYRKVNWNLIPGLGYENVLFIVLYAVIGYHCYHTIGEQYIEAINKAERDGIEIPNTIGYARSAASKFLEEGFEDEKKSSWFNFDLDAPPPPKKEFRLPSQYLPGFWPLLFLGTVAVLHVLIQLLQVWSIKFKCLLHYRLVGSVEDATHVRVIPKANSGKPGLYPIERSSSLGTTFAFHRRRYQWDPRTDVFEKIRCRTDLPLRLFKTAAGHDSPVKLDLARARYGSNKFEMKAGPRPPSAKRCAVPTFKDLYVQQLLSPFTCFQLFCVLLWCLDEYWQYSLFSLFMIFSFEGATVFTRLKNMNLLRGMGNTARPVLVRRAGKWEEATTESPPASPPAFLLPQVEADSDIVPCDCLLLRGAAVLNEATLTGESIPQMKEGLNAFPEEALNVKGAGKVHTLFGGTKILQAEPGLQHIAPTHQGGDGEGKDAAAAAAAEGVPDPPDGGCLAYVLRTGFSSSQGKLVRMIEGSTEKVRGDARDTALLLLLLLCFAVGSAAYVLAHGMEDEDRSKYELLLHCILIVTSVVPPELPMQMALAVNTALMTMMKLHIFCTEPFRVPLAGKVDVCLFDKTGTLTTDQLVAVGVATGQGPAHGKGDAEGAATAVPLAAMTKASPHATLVLGGCQALVVVDGETVGDPIEAAALQAIDWELAPAAAAGRAAVVRPKPGSRKVSAEVAALMGPLEGLEVVARHHFTSRLQRMSTVVRARRGGKAWALVKGSPEAVRKLLRAGAAPAAYEAGRGAGQGGAAAAGAGAAAPAHRRGGGPGLRGPGRGGAGPRVRRVRGLHLPGPQRHAGHREEAGGRRPLGGDGDRGRPAHGRTSCCIFRAGGPDGRAEGGHPAPGRRREELEGLRHGGGGGPGGPGRRRRPRRQVQPGHDGARAARGAAAGPGGHGAAPAHPRLRAHDPGREGGPDRHAQHRVREDDADVRRRGQRRGRAQAGGRGGGPAGRVRRPERGPRRGRPPQEGPGGEGREGPQRHPHAAGGHRGDERAAAEGQAARAGHGARRLRRPAHRAPGPGGPLPRQAPEGGGGGGGQEGAPGQGKDDRPAAARGGGGQEEGGRGQAAGGDPEGDGPARGAGRRLGRREGQLERGPAGDRPGQGGEEEAHGHPGVHGPRRQAGADDGGDGGRRRRGGRPGGRGPAHGEGGRRVHRLALHLEDALHQGLRGHHPPGALHAGDHHPDVPDPGAELPDLGLQPLRALPGRGQVRRPPDDRPGDADVGVVHLGLPGLAAGPAEPRAALLLHLPPRAVPQHPRPVRPAPGRHGGGRAHGQGPEPGLRAEREGGVRAEPAQQRGVPDQRRAAGQRVRGEPQGRPLHERAAGEPAAAVLAGRHLRLRVLLRLGDHPPAQQIFEVGAVPRPHFQEHHPRHSGG
ncbi:unnamed protein product [Heterosigma akashiwo]